MTTIAWDGKTLAADKMGNQDGSILIVTKIRKIGKYLAGSSGTMSSCMALMKWIEDGGAPDKWPECQKDKELCSPLIIITQDKKIFRYDTTPIPYEINQDFYAFGGGRDFATGAMEVGADAKRAIEVASKWDACTGCGVDTLTFDEGQDVDPDLHDAFTIEYRDEPAPVFKTNLPNKGVLLQSSWWPWWQRG